MWVTQSVEVQQLGWKLWGYLAVIPLSCIDSCALPCLKINYTHVEHGPDKRCLDT